MDMTASGVKQSPTPAPLGILAGGGGLPEQIADSAIARGRPVHIVAIKGEAGPGIARFPHTWVNWGAIGRMSASLKLAGCRDLIIVGSVTRPDPRKVRPDFGLIKAIPTIIRLLGGGDDHVLRNVVRFFEAQGFDVKGVADVAPELLVANGTLGSITPRPTVVADADRAFALVDALGFADVGQGVVIRDGRILAIEAAEGTDRMLARLDQVPAICGAILVKRPKPEQELRVDMPVIGPRTVQLAAKMGLAGIVVEAGRVLVAERAQVIAEADRSGLFVAGLETRPGRRAAHSRQAFSLANRMVPHKRVQRDISLAAAAMTVLAEFAASSGIVVVRGHVIAIETGEGLDAMFSRVKTLRQWGATAQSKRRGALAVSASGIEAAGIEAIVAYAAEAGLAGIVLPGANGHDAADRAGPIAEALGLSVAETKGEWLGQTR
jgi:UDP-2,3-diacylglucosamine hydrolase